jgi:predicted nucleic acid-binding protein
MTRFAIDPPTLVRIVESGTPVHAGHQLVAPNSVRSRALDLLLERVRAGALEEREALALHEQMTELKIRVLGDRVSRRTAWNLAMEHGWESVQEAEYVAVAALQADALVTQDPELRARAKGAVRVAKLTELFSE